MSRYEEAKKIYAQFGIDTEAAMERLAKLSVSVHCWQGDDVIGFDGSDSLSGGIQTTGNYPGRARTPEELFADLTTAFKLMPGKKRVNVHACYALLGEMGERNGLGRRGLQPHVVLAPDDERRLVAVFPRRRSTPVLGTPRQGLYEDCSGNR